MACVIGLGSLWPGAVALLGASGDSPVSTCRLGGSSRQVRERDALDRLHLLKATRYLKNPSNAQKAAEALVEGFLPDKAADVKGKLSSSHSVRAFSCWSMNIGRLLHRFDVHANGQTAMGIFLSCWRMALSSRFGRRQSEQQSSCLRVPQQLLERRSFGRVHTYWSKLGTWVHVCHVQVGLVSAVFTPYTWRLWQCKVGTHPSQHSVTLARFWRSLETLSIRNILPQWADALGLEKVSEDFTAFEHLSPLMLLVLDYNHFVSNIMPFSARYRGPGAGRNLYLTQARW